MLRAVQSLIASGIAPKEIALLFPKHAYGDALEQALLAGRVPVKRWGQKGIAERCVLCGRGHRLQR